jgi:hypothetical protein
MFSVVRYQFLLLIKSSKCHKNMFQEVGVHMEEDGEGWGQLSLVPRPQLLSRAVPRPSLQQTKEFVKAKAWEGGQEVLRSH